MQTAKYFSGTYAVCKTCGARPCACQADAPAPAPRPLVALAPAPVSGNAIPFVIWDQLIAAHQLSIVESGVLLYLCRLTHGYGHHAGDLISIAQLASGLNIGRSSAKRALARLDELGLIERNRRHERARKEYATSHIRVMLPST